MFNTKKIVTLSLLLTGVVGSNFCSETTQRSSWAAAASKAIDKAPIFLSIADLMGTARSYYEIHGKLSSDLIHAVSVYNNEYKEGRLLKILSNEEALRVVLSLHPSSPILKGTQKASPTSVADAARMSPLDLKPSVSPTQFSPRS